MIDKPTIDELKAKHGRIFRTAIQKDGEEQVFLFRLPSKAEFGRFMKTISADKSQTLAASTQLCLDCVVYPSDEVFEKLTTATPGICVGIGGEIAKQGGLVEAEDSKEL